MDHRASNSFLSVRLGDYVAIKDDSKYSSSISETNYWFGKVINCIGGARDPNAWTLFQVINIDSGEITIINADTVENIFNHHQN